MKMLRLHYVALALLFIGATSFSVALAADPEPEVKAAVSVSATVPSKVCPQYSSLAVNVTEILADDSQKAIITVKAMDCANRALPDVPLTITSNRGAIDKINFVDENGNVLELGDGTGVDGVTDENGFAFFQTFSNVPGKTTYTVMADGTVTVGQQEVTFLPLPFPKNVVVVAEVPAVISPSGLVTIFAPKDQDIDDDSLVNLTMELRIPVWVFYLSILLTVANLAMFAIILVLSLRIHKLQKVEIADLEAEKALLEKEEAEIEKIADQK